MSLSALILASLLQAAQPAAEQPPATAPGAPAPAPGAELGEDVAEGLPAAPRPYGELPAAPAPGAARPRSPVDTPALPQRGMSGEAWGESVRARLQAAQSRQGSLDGGWTVTDDAGAALFVLQLVDAPGAELEGVWREAPRPGLNPASGLFASASREGARTVLAFDAPRGAGSAELVLGAGAAGWEGTLSIAGTSRAVRLVRNPTP